MTGDLRQSCTASSGVATPGSLVSDAGRGQGFSDFQVVPSPSLARVITQESTETKAQSEGVEVEEKVSRPVLSLRTHLRSMASTRPIRAFATYYANKTGTANTAFAFSYLLQPNLDASWSSWANVFDEIKVIRARIHWSVWFNTLPSGFSGQAPNAVVVYDPGASRSLTSVNEGLEYEHYQLLAVAANASGTYAVSPQAVATASGSAVGLCTFEAKMPVGPQISVSSTILSTGDYRPTADSQDYYWGAFSGYCAAGGASSVLEIQAFIRMEVELRVRV